MKKSILAIAVAATMAAPAAVMAAPTVYGNVHLSINDVDTAENLDISSNTSAIGVKGSEDLGDGLKAIYKVEFGVDIAGKPGDGFSDGKAAGGLSGRDQFVGLKGGMGTIKLGTMSSNYKQMGSKVDALYRTPVEGRGLIHTQSGLHGGKGINAGRQTNTVQYVSPKMGGIQLVANTTLSDSDDETSGIGLRWSSKAILVYADWIDGQTGAAVATGGTTESAMKIGGKFTTKAFFIAGQYEDAEDRTEYNYIHVNGGFNINKNNAIIATVGQASHISDGNADTQSFALAYNHKLSKMTNVYAAYGDKSSDAAALENSVLTFGVRKKF